MMIKLGWMMVYLNCGRLHQYIVKINFLFLTATWGYYSSLILRFNKLCWKRKTNLLLRGWKWIIWKMKIRMTPAIQSKRVMRRKQIKMGRLENNTYLLLQLPK